MIEVIGIVVGLWLLRYLVYLPFLTSSRRSNRFTVRLRVPFRDRYPRLWRALVVFGLVVVAPVGLLASACDWWGL
ncbi:hypothetical protein [Actinomadura sp. 6N118]|uniref:hypothetical protein n=1 Tax=Actinomadura sp. 6N118 TaxID=3375151 RepID=UPI00379F0C4A